MTLFEHQLAFVVERHDRGGWAVTEAHGELDGLLMESVEAVLASGRGRPT
jgi:hypothetical protein